MLPSHTHTHALPTRLSQDSHEREFIIEDCRPENWLTSELRIAVNSELRIAANSELKVISLGIIDNIVEMLSVSMGNMLKLMEMLSISIETKPHVVSWANARAAILKDALMLN